MTHTDAATATAAPGRALDVMLAALARVAWADGILHAAEAALFADVVEGLGLSDGARAAIYQRLLAPPPLEQLGLAELPDSDQRWLLWVGYRMAASDGRVDASESATLREIAEAMGVSDADRQAILYKAVAAMVDGPESQQ